MKDLIIDVPEWLSDCMNSIANEVGKSVDEVAAYFFASEVVHTPKNFSVGVVHT